MTSEGPGLQSNDTSKGAVVFGLVVMSGGDRELCLTLTLYIEEGRSISGYKKAPALGFGCIISHLWSRSLWGQRWNVAADKNRLW